MAVHNIGRTEKAEMYLKAVQLLGREVTPVTVTRVAEFMGVSVPSASEMLKRLESNGLVDLKADEGIALSAEGEREASHLLRRMRLAECLLADLLHMPIAELYDEACRLEHAISERLEQRLMVVLGHPEYCPHGHPIPRAGTTIPPPVGVPLAELQVGEGGVVRSIPERDAQLVGYLTGLGLRPGAQVHVHDVAPYNGPLFLEIDGGERQAVAREALAQVLIERDS